MELVERVRATLGDLPAFELPTRVLQAVRSVTVAESTPAAKWWTRPVAVVTAVAAAGLLALVLAPGRKTPPPQTNAAEVERVTAGTRLALAYLGSAAQRAEARVKSRVVEDRAIVATLDGVSTSLKWARGSEDKPTTKVENEGSL